MSAKIRLNYTLGKIITFSILLNSPNFVYGGGDHHHEGSHHEGSHARGKSKQSLSKKLQTMDPVTDRKIDKTIFVDHQGNRIYFSDNNSKNMFLADPEDYVGKMTKNGITFSRLQEICPVSDEQIDLKIFTEHNGNNIYFCCKKCRSSFKKNPDKYLNKNKVQGDDSDNIKPDVNAGKEPAAKEKSHHEGLHSHDHQDH